MKPINNFKPEAPKTGTQMLPKGLYVARIMNVKIEGDEPDQRLVLRIEITEGEYANYYTERYQSDLARGNMFGVAKYKGDFRIQIPNEGNQKRQHYDWDLRTFQNAIWAIEDSNAGYHWEWNEASLKGLNIGINVREGSYNGNPYTSIGRLESLKMMAEGKCRVMKDMEPRGEADRTAEYMVSEEVPF